MVYFFSPVYHGSELFLESRVVHAGGKLIYTEVYVMDGKFLVAKGSATFLVKKWKDKQDYKNKARNQLLE